MTVRTTATTLVDPKVDGSSWSEDIVTIDVEDLVLVFIWVLLLFFMRSKIWGVVRRVSFGDLTLFAGILVICVLVLHSRDLLSS